jgi:membrane protease YdiL (CAAX protease family)
VLLLETHLPGSSGDKNPPTRTCPFCQTSGLPINAKFCSYCGQTLLPSPDPNFIICQNCSSSNPSHFKFCAHCGLELLTQPGTALIDDLSKPSSREYYLAADGLISEEPGDTLIQRLLPAFFVLMVSALGLLSVIAAILVLGPFLDSDDESTSQVLQIFASLITLAVLLTPGVFSRFGLTNRLIGLNEDLDIPLAVRTYLALTLIVMLASLLLQFLVLLPIYIFFGTEAEETSPYPDISFTDPTFLLLWVLAAVIIGPAYEEILARGYLIPLLEKRGASPTVAILGSSAIFSGLHLQADLFAMFDEGSTLGAIEFPISHAFSTFVIGMIFGTIYYASGRSLKTCILLHSANNGVATLLLASGSNESLQLWLVFFYFITALVGGGYILYFNRGLFSRELNFARRDLRGGQNAIINYFATISIMAIIPLSLYFLGGFLAYLAWYSLGAILFAVFLYKAGKSPPTIPPYDGPSIR